MEIAAWRLSHGLMISISKTDAYLSSLFLPPLDAKTRAAQLASSIAVNGPRRNDADEGRYASAWTIEPSTDQANSQTRTANRHAANRES